MKNDILEEITNAVDWENLSEWISRQSLAVRGFTRLVSNEEKSGLNYLRKIFSLNNQTGKIRKPLQAVGLSGSEIKKQGFFEKIHTG